VARRAALLLLIALVAPACRSKTSAEEAGVDQEITRNIMWSFRQDARQRFKDVRVTCEGREILIEGRVSDAKAAQDAVQIAMSNSRGGKVISRIDVRLR
jgi:osmotically-inducible protein OsmY